MASCVLLMACCVQVTAIEKIALGIRLGGYSSSRFKGKTPKLGPSLLQNIEILGFAKVPEEKAAAALERAAAIAKGVLLARYMPDPCMKHAPTTAKGHLPGINCSFASSSMVCMMVDDSPILCNGSLPGDLIAAVVVMHVVFGMLVGRARSAVLLRGLDC